MPPELVTFGETMIRLSPADKNRLEQAHLLHLQVGGSELNAAVAAARLGLSTGYVTRLTNNPLGRLIRNKARQHGVDVSQVIWTDEDRVGAYYVEFGASPRPNSVLYDRAHSAMARLRPNEIDWQSALRGARCFHTSGITPALSAGAAEATLEGIKAAKKIGVQVSVDLNYRALLWTEDKARHIMNEVVGLADLLFTTEEDTARVFGIQAETYGDTARILAEQFDLRLVAITLRETPSVWRNGWSAIAYDVEANALHKSPQFDLEVVDRVGAGDAFAGGFLYGYLTGGAEAGLRYGIAISALQQTHPGDHAWATRQEVEAALRGEGLRIHR